MDVRWESHSGGMDDSRVSTEKMQLPSTETAKALGTAVGGQYRGSGIQFLMSQMTYNIYQLCIH